MKSVVVTYDRNFGIGARNDLLWLRDLPADLKHFKSLTSGGVVIMGRKTYESIGRPLPNRQNIVISRQALELEGATVVASLGEGYEASEPGKTIFVIGGGETYRLALSSVDRIYATEVKEEFKADVFFPRIEKSIWREVFREHHIADERNKYDFDFVIYDKI